MDSQQSISSKSQLSTSKSQLPLSKSQLSSTTLSRQQMIPSSSSMNFNPNNQQQRPIRRSKFFPLSRIRYFLENFAHCKTISNSASMGCAIVIEIALTELLQLATEAARNENKRRVGNRHIILALHNSLWLQELFGGQSGMLQPPTQAEQQLSSLSRTKKAKRSRSRLRSRSSRLTSNSRNRIRKKRISSPKRRLTGSKLRKISSKRNLR
ncbi:uncharacterized protein LOC113793504 [Dermatophagoides pteronyssinus]|uniref:uncharacterized protein LOC113793504 n=1 Tax=Dermatophagoides pteronyssinus TaxID=6956 RepID=UPI003F67504B